MSAILHRVHKYLRMVNCSVCIYFNVEIVYRKDTQLSHPFLLLLLFILVKRFSVVVVVVVVVIDKVIIIKYGDFNLIISRAKRLSFLGNKSTRMHGLNCNE